MKKLIIVLSILALSLAFVGCGEKSRSINVYNYGKYIDMTVLDDFEKETGIKVVYNEYETNEEMYQKIKAGASKYDVIFPSEYMVERMARENLLTELDLNALPNMKNMDPEFLNKDYDAGNKYSVPYFWGTLGILYNTEMVTEPVKSWDILWNEKYTGNILMQNSMRDAFAVSLKSLGYSLNTKDDAQLKEAQEKLVKQIPLVYAYVVDEAQDKMIGNEAALAVIYSGEAYNAMLENPALSFALPPEGSNIWIDSMAIPASTGDKEGALQFINFMMRPDIAARCSEYVGYPSANKGAYELVPADMQNHPALYPEKLPEDLEFLKDLGDYNQVYDELWTKFKSN